MLTSLSHTLRSGDYREFLANMYGDQPAIWSDQLAGWDRLRFITNAFTRMRYYDPQNQLLMGTHWTS